MAILVASTNIGDEEGVNTGLQYPMGYFLQFGYRRLGTVVRDSLDCILSMYIYMYRYNTVLVNKVRGFHMADRGTELRTLFPPQTCLVNSSFCYIFFVFPNFHHAAILFPSSQELFMSYVHIHRGLLSHRSGLMSGQSEKILGKSRFRKYRSQVCFVMTGLHIQSS